MSYGLLILRAVLGLVFAAHGTRKLFGWFGGGGLSGTAAVFGRLRFRAPLMVAVVGGLTELGAGLLLAAGLLTPLAALGLATLMVNAIATAHWHNGLWATKGGWEYNLLIYTVAIALATAGPGRFSVDAALGWADQTAWWGAGVFVASLALSAATRTLGRRQAAAPSAVS
jgi:putative oxidoreductase